MKLDCRVPAVPPAVSRAAYRNSRCRFNHSFFQAEKGPIDPKLLYENRTNKGKVMVEFKVRTRSSVSVFLHRAVVLIASVLRVLWVGENRVSWKRQVKGLPQLPQLPQYPDPVSTARRARICAHANNITR